LLLALVLTSCTVLNTDGRDIPAAEQKPYRILITNDDGIESAGIQQLAREVANFAEVVVVAPARNESGASQSSRLLSLNPQATAYEIGDSITAYAMNGTPSDCVAFGVRWFGIERPFDLVLSGINEGGNVGSSYFYSGTIGAAFQGLSDNIAAIAVSQDQGREEFDVTIAFTTKVIRSVMAEPMPPGVLWSINVPAGDIQGVKVLPADGQPYNVKLEPFETEAGTQYRPRILPLDQPLPGHDIEAFRKGSITVTPLMLDRNAYDHLKPLGKRPFVSERP
jgi:5'-nucleotidase